MLRATQTIRCLVAMLLFAGGGAYAASSVEVYQDPG